MKVTFVHGRPGPHPIHRLYGESVTSRHRVVDPWLRWHDCNPLPSWKYFCWIVNAFSFISFRKSVVVTEGLHITVVIAKFLSLGRLRIVCLADDESPYFIKSRYYRGLSYSANVFALRSYDGIICIGKMVTDIVKEIVGSRPIPIRTGVNGVSAKRLTQLLTIPRHSANVNIVCIANGPGGWRTWYKGIDLMLAAFAEVADEIPTCTIQIVGSWDNDEVQKLKLTLPSSAAERVQFLGYQSNFGDVLANAGLCLHIGRGEAWGIGVLEAMAAGVPAMVSEWTGAKECVAQVDPALIVPLDLKEIASRLRWYVRLSDADRKDLAEKSRQVAAQYTEARAVSSFADNFKEITAAF